MGSRTRIRWMNVAKLAAAAIGCTVLVVGLPALLERPKPPPLPDDIGLAHAREAAPVTPARTSRMTHPAKHHAKAKDPEPEPRHPHHHERRVRNREQASGPPAPDPVTASTPPPAAPAPPAPPAPPVSPPPYLPPTPAPVATSSPSPPASSSPGRGAGQPSGPSEFGFER